jgi:hypothetical protein
MSISLETVQTEFQNRISLVTVSPESIILILQYAMETVEVTTLKGEEKKDAVVDLVRKAVVDAPIESRVESILLEMIDDGIIKHTIDIVVSASRGKLNLNGVTSAGHIVCSNIGPHLGKCITSCLPGGSK